MLDIAHAPRCQQLQRRSISRTALRNAHCSPWQKCHRPYCRCLWCYPPAFQSQLLCFWNRPCSPAIDKPPTEVLSSPFPLLKSADAPTAVLKEVAYLVGSERVVTNRGVIVTGLIIHKALRCQLPRSRVPKVLAASAPLPNAAFASPMVLAVNAPLPTAVLLKPLPVRISRPQTKI